MSTAVAANLILEIAPAPAAEATEHFERLLAFETDCWDVHHTLGRPDLGFVLLDVRAPQLYAEGHVPRAISLPHRRIDAKSLAQFPPDTLFVVYCSGPHCNGADRAALRLAQLGRPVKKMIGGMTGWLDEGFELERE